MDILRINPDVLKVTPAINLKTGTYSLEGFVGNAQTATYRGAVIISKSGGVYHLNWQIGPVQNQRGIGILNEKVLSVSYVDETGENLNDVGVVSYTVINEGKLDGKWSSILSDKTAREVLTWISE